LNTTPIRIMKFKKFIKLIFFKMKTFPF